MTDSRSIVVNGARRTVQADPDTPLLYVLQCELGLQGPRFGCGLAQRGSCSVLVDGVETRSCVIPVSAVEGRSVTTLEGLPAWYAARRRLAHGWGGGVGRGASPPPLLHSAKRADCRRFRRRGP